MNAESHEDVKASSNIQVEKLGETMNSTIYEKPSSLVDVANNTFKELCLTLEHEQAKLVELEQRRKKLQEEMQLLKMEIEEEKKAYHLNISLDTSTKCVESLASSSSSTVVSNKQQLDLQSGSTTDIIDEGEENGGHNYQHLSSTSIHLPPLDTCFEVDESNEESEPEEGDSQTDFKEMNSVAKSIHKQLQGVVAECIIEQCKIDDVSSASDEIF